MLASTLPRNLVLNLIMFVLPIDPKTKCFCTDFLSNTFTSQFLTSFRHEKDAACSNLKFITLREHRPEPRYLSQFIQDIISQPTNFAVIRKSPSYAARHHTLPAGTPNRPRHLHHLTKSSFATLHISCLQIQEETQSAFYCFVRTAGGRVGHS